MLPEPSLQNPRIDEDGDSNYAPCPVGIHLCGICDDGTQEQPYTALNIEAPNHTVARAMWNAAKEEAEVNGDEWDFICDLNLGAGGTIDCVDDFGTNRQMVKRLIHAALQAKSLASRP